MKLVISNRSNKR